MIDPAKGATMADATVEELVRLRGAPAVSILCPLDRRQPGNPEDATMLATLRARVEQQVRASAPEAVATALMARVADTLATIDLGHPSAGFAVFVSAEFSRVIMLESPVEADVLVGERFAVRGLVSALQRVPRARVVLLSQAETRCVDISGDCATERRDAKFPVRLRPPTEADTPHGDYPLDEHEAAEATKFVFRGVDDAIAHVQRRDHRALVVVGTERDLAYFDEITAHAASIVGRVHGNYERDSEAAVAALVQPVLEAHRRDQLRQECHRVREAIPAHAVAGITDTWAAVLAGRGHELIVDGQFRYPAWIADGVLVPAGAEGPDVVDAVELAVEEVLRHGGEVVVVDADLVADLGRIALLTRY
jgi:hypothetical protein